MKAEYKFYTARQIAEMIANGKIIADPIGQRPPVSVNLKKSVAIIGSLFKSGIGMITVRDISNDPISQKIYPGAQYLVIDGGHRCRAISAYYNNKLGYNGEKFAESSIDLNDYVVPFDIRVCDSNQACDLFRTINESTPVNRMEALMANEDSTAATIIRKLTTSYREYGDNKVHRLFARELKSGVIKSEHFEMEPNHRRKWDEWAAIAFVYLHKAHTDKIGWEDVHSLIEEDRAISKETLKTINRFFDDAVDFRANRGKKFNGDVWDAFFTIWFGFYNYKSKEFKINDRYAFAKEFVRVYSKLTGTADTSLDDVTIKVNKETHMIKEWFRKEVKNHFSDPFTRKLVFDTFTNYFSDRSITYRTEQRSLPTEKREEYLAKQGYVCAIDGLPLELSDSVWGHDTSWAEGGELSEGAVIRKEHNRKMGQTTLEEYRMILQLRKTKQAA
jgi:hypothetical protein